jgi:hypothetical protein
VKDVIESLGVPHTEVALVLVDGRPVGLGHRLRAQASVEAFAAEDAIPGASAGASADAGLGEVSKAAADASPGPQPRFVLDGHLGRLAAYLRALGFDTLYRRDATDAELATVVERDPERILLSRDLGLLKRRVVTNGAFVRADRPHDQLVETWARFALAARARPFTRCMRCNGLLEPLERSVARSRVPPRVFEEQATFRRCPDCKGVYWRGSHHRRMWALFTTLLPDLASAGGPSPAD